MIKSLTSLRGIFILFIFFHHCLNIYPGGGTMAVAFFFVLGGFSMTLGYKDRVLIPEFSYRQYFVRRCIKFYPLHWLCLLSVIPLTLGSFHWKHIPIFMINATLTQTLIPIKTIYFSFNAVSWYLADTLFFAILFPPTIKWLLKATRTIKKIVIAIIVMVYLIIVAFIPQEWYHYVLYISPYVRLTDFIFGIFLALVYLEIKKQKGALKFFQNGSIGILLLVGLLVMLVVESCLLEKPYNCIAPLYWPLIALIILVASLASGTGGLYRLIENDVLLRLGELSFIIFLTHQIVINYTNRLFYCLAFENKIVFVITAFVMTLVISFIVEKNILIPITQWLSKKILPSMTVRS